MDARIIIFDEEFGVMVVMVSQDALNGRICWVLFRRDAEVVGQLAARIVLLQGCCKTFVEIRLEAFAGPDSGDMWDVILTVQENGCLSRDAAVVSEPDKGKSGNV